MSKWLCLNCGQSEGVVSGVCRRCGPTKTNPVDDEAKKEANVEGAAADREAEEAAQKEAEERNAASVEASEGTTIDPSKL